jgi:NAD(P)-dependent dehydrogenase (short-subunit alcohol dehydrogenase family)
MSHLKGTIAVVTGGSRGIGFGIARALLEHGAGVVITGTKQETLDAAARELRSAAGGGAVVDPVRADVRKYDEVERLMNGVVQRHGGIDVLVNNAGIGVFSPVADMTPDQWHSVIDTNVTGVFYCCRAAIPHLRARGGGWIINISSLAGKNAFVNGGAYCASKAALNQFSEALMQEVRYDGIRVSYIMPGSVSTDFGGLERSAGKREWAVQIEDIGRLVTDLVAHPSRSLPSRIEIRPSQPPRKG